MSYSTVKETNSTGTVWHAPSVHSVYGPFHMPPSSTQVSSFLNSQWVGKQQAPTGSMSRSAVRVSKSKASVAMRGV